MTFEPNLRDHESHYSGRPYGHAAPPARRKSLLWRLVSLILIPGVVLGVLTVAAMPLAFG